VHRVYPAVHRRARQVAVLPGEIDVYLGEARPEFGRDVERLVRMVIGDAEEERFRRPGPGRQLFGTAGLGTARAQVLQRAEVRLLVVVQSPAPLPDTRGDVVDGDRLGVGIVGVCRNVPIRSRSGSQAKFDG